MPDTTKPPSSSSRADVIGRLMAQASGLAAVLGIFVLVGLGRLEPNEGLPWIAATLSGLAHLRNGSSSRK